MAHYYFKFLMLLSCFLVEVTSMPANQEETATLHVDMFNEDFKPYQEEREEKSLPNEQVLTEVQDDSTKDIMEKIRAINDALKKPPKRQQINWNNQPQTGGGYIMDKEILEKLQQIIASGKLHGLPEPYKPQDDNLNDIRYSRKINFVQRNQMPIMSMPYMTSLPVLMMPPMNNMVGGYPIAHDLNSLEVGSYQTKQSESPSPFQFQWPFASFFPVLIRDPLLSILNGGGWSNFIEYGQSADVCSKKHKSVNVNIDKHKNSLRNYIAENNNEILQDSIDSYNAREGRAIKKRNVPHRVSTKESEKVKSPKKIYSIKPASINKPLKQSNDDEENSKTNVDEAALRLPFFGWLGNKKVVSPPPTFYINKLKVRKGGVAIAGPGGVATAGKGGTAIVGPGGLAYTQPGGLAVAGPAARIVALSKDVDLSSVVSRLQQQATTDGSVPQLLEAIPEGKVVATGPVIYYHPKQHTSVHYIPFYGGAKGQYLEVKKNSLGNVTSERIVSEEKISSEVVKNTDENILAKLLAANLQNLRSITNNLLKLHNLGRKTGYLGNTEKVRFRTQLASLAEAASNSIKLIEDIGDNVDALFKKNSPTNKLIPRRYGQPDNEDDEIEDNYGDDGVGVEAPPMYTDDYVESTIAEAKPFGLAVIGEHGLAASRPVGTAIAASGVALARPIGTAIAGIDPSVLGLNFQINQFTKH